MSRSSHSHPESSGSVWSLLNLVIGAFLAVFVLYFGGSFIVQGMMAANKIRNPQAPAAAAPADAAAPAAAAPAAASSGPAQELSLKPDAVNPMGYATKEFTVKANQTIKLTFENVGASVPQPHNVVISKAGTKDALMALAAKAMTDPKAVGNGFIPEDPIIIAHVKLLQPGQKGEVEFSLPAPGDYPFACTFPGHSILMNGVIKAQ